MTLESDVEALIRQARGFANKRADEVADETQGVVIALTGWLNGIDDALILLAREIDDLKTSRDGGDKED